MRIKIIVDSASDITQEEAKELGITVLPLTVTFGETSYLDGIDMNHFEFYDKLIETDEFPVTSQISPYTYSETFKTVLDNGDEVLCITLSSKLSGTYQSANIAASEFDEGVYIVDSENVTMGQRLVVLLALRLINEGKSISEIVDILNTEKKKVRLIAVLDTLEYLKKGGRISSAVAAAGSLLSIKPVIAISNGEVAFLGMARGSKNVNNKLKELIQKEGGINFSNPFCLAYTGHTRNMLDKYIADSSELYEGHISPSDIPVSTVGCAIGSHIGPGAIGASFFCPSED